MRTAAGVIRIYPNCKFPLNLEVAAVRCARRWALIEILRSDAPSTDVFNKI